MHLNPKLTAYPPLHIAHNTSSLGTGYGRDFASPQTLRIEFGLSNEMEQYDRNFKVRQLMGETSVSTRSGRK